MRVFTQCLVAGFCALAAASAVQAQTVNPANRSLPNPAGLQSMYPAGISSGSGAAQSPNALARADSPIPAGGTVPNSPNASTGAGVRVPAELFPVDAGGALPSTAVMGAGGSVIGPSQYGNSGAGGYSATDIARSFFFADANHDGELTRAEARRLTIAPESFEEMDRNFDGVISRFEYEDATR